MTQAPNISSYGDYAVLIHWETKGFSEDVHDAIHDLATKLRQSGKYSDVVPAYNSLLCVIDLATYSLKEAKQHIKAVLEDTNRRPKPLGKHIDIPVHYGGENGPDIETICHNSKLSIDDVIARHSQVEYLVCMMGFIPGFTFLSPAPAELHHPRLATPRTKVPAGSIGIANWQTGIYGLESPGGWQIIGRTPLSIFDGKREPSFLLQAGDRVRFIPQ